MKLPELHIDVLLSIVQYLGAPDIIHLGQTCRTFYDLCEGWTVWKGALDYMNVENAVFPSTLSLSSQDSSLTQLRRDATAPARFIHLLKNHPTHNEKWKRNPLPPHLRRVMNPSITGEKYNTVVLVAGGRIVVTGSSAFLSLWDLDGDTPQLVYSWEFTVYHIIGVCLSRQRYLRVVAVSPTIVDRQMELRIFDFDYSTSTPMGIYSLNWELEGDSGVFFPMHTLSGDHFLYSYKGVLFIWNFVRDTWSSWSIINEDYEELFVDVRSNIVIFISRKSVSGWRPNLQIATSRAKAKAEPQPITPEFIFEVPNLPLGIDQPDYQGDRMWNREAIWYESTDFSRIFDIASMENGALNYTFSTYEIHLPGSDGDPGRVEFICRDHLPLNTVAAVETAVNAYRISNGKLFKIFSNEGTVQIAFRHDPRFPTSQFELEEDPCFQVDLGLLDVPAGDTLGIGAFSFDPVSGKLCHLINDGEAIAVLDYLPQ
ncbi:hypothetical protein BJ165DRAFT_1524597 [Panaeolus papilionaceus]|nr:hypothetical protein BJ165DRAFT_1524597 [Panaeolus papilionaceus]